MYYNDMSAVDAATEAAQPPATLSMAAAEMVIFAVAVADAPNRSPGDGRPRWSHIIRCSAIGRLQVTMFLSVII